MGVGLRTAQAPANGRHTALDSPTDIEQPAWEIVELAGGKGTLPVRHSRALVLSVIALTAVIGLSVLGRLFEPAGQTAAVGGDSPATGLGLGLVLAPSPDPAPDAEPVLTIDSPTAGETITGVIRVTGWSRIRVDRAIVAAYVGDVPIQTTKPICLEPGPFAVDVQILGPRFPFAAEVRITSLMTVPATVLARQKVEVIGPGLAIEALACALEPSPSVTIRGGISEKERLVRVAIVDAHGTQLATTTLDVGVGLFGGRVPIDAALIDRAVGIVVEWGSPLEGTMATVTLPLPECGRSPSHQSSR